MGINFNRAEFVLSAVNAANFVRDGRPQVTFAGRSNVGKSSVINRILNRKNFARVGATPGKTTQINYFRIDDKIYFTDLPGYGYAKVSKGERDRWGMLMERYFAEAGLVTLGVLIVDARHKPTANDVIMANWFQQSGRPYVVVANKMDKLKKSEIEPNLAAIRQTLSLEEDVPLVRFSAEKGEGRDVLLGEVDVVVCDGFSGNVLLKSIEGTAYFMGSLMKHKIFKRNILSMIGYLFCKKGVDDVMKMMDYREIGGTQFLGIKKPVIKAHGSSDALAFRNAVGQAVQAVHDDFSEDLEDVLKRLTEEKQDD